MKRILPVLCFLLTSYFAGAQPKDYRVAFDISTDEAISQQAVIREVELIKNSSPDAKLEVVVYGKALNLVVKDKSEHAEEIQKLLAMKDVSFKVCAITMKRNNVDKSQLLPGIETVPDGIYELFSKQREGWGYIKVAH